MRRLTSKVLESSASGVYSPLTKLQQKADQASRVMQVMPTRTWRNCNCHGTPAAGPQMFSNLIIQCFAATGA